MHVADIDIFLIAKTAPDPAAMAQWMEYHKTEYRPPLDELTGAEATVGMAAKRCYLSFEPGLNPNVTKVRSDWTDYLDNILKSGHGSVLEHATFTFAIEGVTRVFTAEMNRHRAGVAISEGSLRYIRFNDVPLWIPPIFRDAATDDDRLRYRKVRTRELFAKVFQTAEDAYIELCELCGIDKEGGSFSFKKVLTSAFRRIIPLGVCTGGVWTLNVRALRHVISMRAAPEAEEEIAYVFSRIGKMMVESEPRLFGDFVQDANGFWKPTYRKV